MTESLIGTSALFHKAVNPAVVVEPVEAPFHLPALARVAGMPEFRCKDGSVVVPAPRNDGMNVSGQKGLTEHIAVISLVRAKPYQLPDTDAINRAERQRLVMTIGAGNNERKKAPARINDDTPFYPIDTVFSRVSTVFLAPFFDFTTDASRYPLRQWR